MDGVRHLKWFTMIELLITIAIIAILVALLFPALGRAKMAVLKVSCLNNLKQYAVKINYYVDSYNGFLPPAYTDDAVTWVVRLEEKNLADTYKGTGQIPQPYLCPSAVKTYTCPPSWIYQTYGWNLGTANHALKSVPFRMAGALSTQIALVDTKESGAGTGFGWLILNSGMWNVSDFRHLMSANLLFMDGHAGDFRLQAYDASLWCYRNWDGSLK